MVSADHLAIGFSSLDIGCFSGLFERSSIADGCLCLYTVDADREQIVSTVHRAEAAANSASASASGRRKRRPSAAASANFENRFRELLEFREINGHTRVPRRHGQLGDWVNKLRQRKYQLDEQRLDRLNEIGFCWDASDDKRRKEREKWWERLESLSKSQQQNVYRQAEAGSEKFTPVDASSSLGVIHQQSSVLSIDILTGPQKKWLRRQRIEYIDSGRKPSPKLEEKQIQALNEIDPNWWQTARERKWDAQYIALTDFQAKHGHCNVTNAHKDKKLFNWVQNTRKKYRAVKLQHEDRLRSDGSPKLSKVQIQLLDIIDFNWDPWGHYADCSWLFNTNSPDKKATSL